MSVGIRGIPSTANTNAYLIVSFLRLRAPVHLTQDKPAQHIQIASFFGSGFHRQCYCLHQTQSLDPVCYSCCTSPCPQRCLTAATKRSGRGRYPDVAECNAARYVHKHTWLRLINKACNSQRLFTSLALYGAGLLTITRISYIPAMCNCFI